VLVQAQAQAQAESATPAPAAAAPAPAPAARQTQAAAANSKGSSAKSYTPQQQSLNFMAEAVALEQQGRQQEAKVPLQRALAVNPLHTAARQMLVGLNMDTGQLDEARALLAEGHRLQPEQPDFTLALARLRVESGDVPGALQLLEAGRPGARDDPQYNAMLAALLLRVQRYEDAVMYYLVALRADPANASWLIGVGVALEGAGKPADAAEAYRRADTVAKLSPDMARFVTERLSRLGR
jgi:MSHA biogenesis protein MshN